MHTTFRRPRIVAWALALLVLLAALPTGRLAATSARANDLAAGCARAAVASTWQGTFTFSFSGSASGDGRSATVSESASYNIQFGDFRAAEPDSPTATWQALDVTGTVTINDSGADGGMTMRTQASGSPLPSRFPGELGRLKIDTSTCAYTLDTSLSVNALNDLEGDGGEVTRDDISALAWQVTRTLSEGADLTISGSASLPVLTGGVDPDEDYAGISGGHAAHNLISILATQGMASAGMASVSWSLRPVAPQPRISKLELLRAEYPSGDLVPVTADGVVDGDSVMVVATLENPTGAALTLPLRFMDGESGQVLPEGERSQLLPPNSTLPVMYPLKTEGWTWSRQAAPASLAAAPTAHPDNQIQVKLGTDQNLYDTETKPLRVRVRPVVLVHGLNSNSGTWSKYPGFLHEINFTWKAYPVHLQTGFDIVSQQRSELLVKNARTLADWVEHVQREEQTWHVDIVAHSMGGLISREYIHSFMPMAPDSLPVVRHLVMLGTPNRGSSCAYLILGINVLHDIPNLLAPLELTPESVARFNQRVVNQKGTKFSVLVGDDNKFKCELTNLEPSDDVVLASSARYTFVHAYTDSAHTSMTESHDDFTRFVMPMLLDRTHSARTTPNSGVILQAAQAQAAPGGQLTQVVSRTLAPGGSLEIPLVMPRAERAAVLLVAPESVTATLLNPSGTAIATSAAHSPAARAWVRSLATGQAAEGTWRLRLESQGAAEAPVIAAVQLAGGHLAAEAAAGEPDAEKRVPLTLRLSDGGAPVRGATVTASLVGTDGARAELALHDDGQHGDGAAGDGLYGAMTSPLTGGTYAAVVSARSGEQVRMTVVAVAAGAPAASHSLFLPLVRR